MQKNKSKKQIWRQVLAVVSCLLLWGSVSACGSRNEEVTGTWRVVSGDFDISGNQGISLLEFLPNGKIRLGAVYTSPVGVTTKADLSGDTVSTTVRTLTKPAETNPTTRALFSPEEKTLSSKIYRNVSVRYEVLEDNKIKFTSTILGEEIQEEARFERNGIRLKIYSPSSGVIELELYEMPAGK